MGAQRQRFQSPGRQRGGPAAHRVGEVEVALEGGVVGGQLLGLLQQLLCAPRRVAQLRRQRLVLRNCRTGRLHSAAGRACHNKGRRGGMSERRSERRLRGSDPSLDGMMIRQGQRGPRTDWISGMVVFQRSFSFDHTGCSSIVACDECAMALFQHHERSGKPSRLKAGPYVWLQAHIALVSSRTAQRKRRRRWPKDAPPLARGRPHRVKLALCEGHHGRLRLLEFGRRLLPQLVLILPHTHTQSQGTREGGPSECLLQHTCKSSRQCTKTLAETGCRFHQHRLTICDSVSPVPLPSAPRSVSLRSLLLIRGTFPRQEAASPSP